jgi:tetratricopeptide (TPR) repeat protein
MLVSRLMQLARGVVMFCVLLHASMAAAEKPWEAGITPKTRATAQALFEAGNQLFAQQAHAPALEKYKQAIALWDHPLIRLNMAVTELELDRVLEAADDLDAALRFGAAPFSDEEYRNALDQQELIAKRVGYIEASCTEPDAQVLLDGAPWLSCPASAKRRVLVGTHVLVGEKDEYVTIARRVTIAASATSTESLRFTRQESAVELSDDPVPLWRSPWIWSSAALLAAGTGVTFHILAREDQDRLDRIIADSAHHDFAEAEALVERGDRRATLATSFYIGAGALVVAAVTFALWPRSRSPVSASTQARLGLSIAPSGWQVTWRY